MIEPSKLEIRKSSDFPTPAEADRDAGLIYKIKAISVTDDDPTKTNTGQVFYEEARLMWNKEGFYVSVEPSKPSTKYHVDLSLAQYKDNEGEWDLNYSLSIMEFLEDVCYVYKPSSSARQKILNVIIESILNAHDILHKTDFNYKDILVKKVKTSDLTRQYCLKYYNIHICMLEFGIGCFSYSFGDLNSWKTIELSVSLSD